MKRSVMALIAGASLWFLTACATPFPVGTIYTELKLPVAVTSANTSRHEKVGTAECTSVLALVTTGDASIQTAMKNGGIKKIHHVDWEVQNILGIIGKYKVVVYGE